ncbi:MAG: iron-containing alcohol dehydrogenase [Candidatus Lokiarchaeota archaeon]|nr:iron-containing alcohol dehydrogenase [Candidatus Lokiarchaeota archaeon]
MENLNFFNFLFRSPRIIFGRGKISTLGEQARILYGKDKNKKINAFLVTGKSSLKKSGNLEKILKNLNEAKISVYVYNEIEGEPTTLVINRGKELAIENKTDVVIGIGGGSVIDSAKGISGLVTNGGIVQDYHAGKRSFDKPGLPFIVAPTTSGTGSEVSNNAVIIDPARGIKQSIRGDKMMAHIVILDPELVLSCPKKYTAFSGADALVQSIEAFVSKSSNYLSDIFAIESIKLLLPSLPKVVNDLLNIELREKMMLGSFLDGLAFATSKLGAVHGFAHPIGVKHKINHGLICGLLLPYVMKYNAELVYVQKKYAYIADIAVQSNIVTEINLKIRDCPDSINDKAVWIIELIKKIFEHCEIPLHLKDIGITEEDIDDIVKDTKGSSLNNNPRDTDKQSLKQILLNAL